MQEEAKNEEVKKDQAMVDIDTSGPGANVELEKEKPEIEIDTKDSSDSTPAAEPVEKKKEELETYSKDVQRRIAKLTKKWREAQRQADEALSFAKIQKEEKEKIQKNILQ